MPQLSLPTTRVHASFLGALAEYRAEGCFPEFDALDVTDPRAFAAYVRQSRTAPHALYRPGLPPMTMLWWTDGPSYLGRLSVWHRLEGALADTGHIGYDVRASARGQGHATTMLAAAVPFVRALGIDPALITVSPANTASRKVIEANGARLITSTPSRLSYHL
ncbi:GNAT family N-acetyltransferase [Kitasatospora sp. NPDC094028]